MRGETVVELKHVSFSYGSAEDLQTGGRILSDIDLTIRNGEFVLLTGPSGCGKTTVLRLINGLIPHFYPGKTEGEVLIDGANISGRELYETGLLTATVFQNPRTQFYNVDTTGELAFACENRGLPEKEIYGRIDQTVSTFAIEDLMDRSIFQLSGGEKQKIACAGADVAGPGIILLDEPSANLDHEATLSLRSMIANWRRQGKTIIAADHRIFYLWDLIDRAVIMQDGRITAELSGKEKDAMRPDDLAAMGLRTSVAEAPDQIALPGFSERDTPVTLKDFYFSYRGRKAPVLDISRLLIAQGEITALTGPNGAGKTSLLNCLCGLERGCRGKLEYKGKLYDRKERRKLCYLVMQDTGNQLFTESVLDEVCLSLPKGAGDAESRAKDILIQLDLDGLSDRHPQSLSGGQKQRLAIASALASGREILLFDEPTSGLDHRHMIETAQLFEKLKQMGKTILVVTHDSELIHACCTRILRVPGTIKFL